MIFLHCLFAIVRSGEVSYIADRSKICGQSVGKSGIVESENILRANESCIYRIFPERDDPVKFTFLSLKQYENTTETTPRQLPDCSFSKIFIISNSQQYGPYCQDSKSELRNRRNAQSNVPNQLFNGKEIDLVYAAGPSGSEYHFKFQFQWQLVNASNECPISMWATDMAVLAQPILSNDIEGEFEMYQTLYILLDTLRMIEDDDSIECMNTAKFISCEHNDAIDRVQTIDDVLNLTQRVVEDIADFCTDEFNFSLDNITESLHEHLENIKYITDSQITTTKYSNKMHNQTAALTVSSEKVITETHICPWPVEAWGTSSDTSLECNIRALRQCNLPLFAETLSDDCRETASYQMSSILQKVQNAFSRAGGVCSVPRYGVDCSIVAIKNSTRPLQFIKEVKKMSRSLLETCESSFRVDVSITLKQLYNTILKCKSDRNSDLLQIGERGLSVTTDVRTCSIQNFLSRNGNVFKRRSISLKNPSKAVDHFFQIGKMIENANDTCKFDVDKISCDITYFPKSEVACQLSLRTKHIVLELTRSCGKSWISKKMQKVLIEFDDSSQQKYGKCPSLGQPMDKETRKLLRRVDENHDAFAQIEADINQMRDNMLSQIDNENHEACYLSDIISKFSITHKSIKNLKETKKPLRKILGRLGDLMNYMTFVDLSGQCPANEIVIDCTTVQQFLVAVNVRDISHHLAKVSRHYNNNCDTYDFITQYIARSFSSSIIV